MNTNKNVISLNLRETQGQSEFICKSVEWIVNHINLAKHLCKDDIPLSFQDFEKEVQKAIKTQDHAYFALLLYQKILQK